MIEVTSVEAVVYVDPLTGREHASVTVEAGGVKLAFTIWKNSETSFAWRSGSNIVRSQKNLLNNKQSAIPPLVKLIVDNWDSLDHIELKRNQSADSSEAEVPQL